MSFIHPTYHWAARFRVGRLDNPASFEDGKTWDDYQNEDYVEYRPHYQAYMWAAFLQAYVLTGHQEFLDKTKCAIRMTMKVFPKLVWTNGITQEYARLLLPLAFLVQVEDTRRTSFLAADRRDNSVRQHGRMRRNPGNDGGSRIRQVPCPAHKRRNTALPKRH